MLCSRSNCNFIRHVDKKHNGGTHCCLACKMEGKGHDPLCEQIKLYSPSCRLNEGNITISLGFSCESAIKSINLGIRTTKDKGYLTCPFDLCLTNYAGIILCIQENFKHFCDTSYLSVIPASFSAGTIIKSERLIYNTRYNFIFNHESPDHVSIWSKEAWSGGKTHFIDNNFAFFIKRYKQRVSNFLRYLQTGEITFIIGNNEPNLDELNKIIQIMYPKLVFNFLHYRPFLSTELYDAYHKLMRRNT